MQPMNETMLRGSGRPDMDALMARFAAQRAARAQPPQFDELPAQLPDGGDPRMAQLTQQLSAQFGPEVAQRFGDFQASRRRSPPPPPQAPGQRTGISYPTLKGGAPMPGGTAVDPNQPPVDDGGLPLPGRRPRQDLSGVTTNAAGQQIITGRGGREQALGRAAQGRLPPPSGPIVADEPSYAIDALVGDQASMPVPPGAPQTATIGPDGVVTTGHGGSETSIFTDQPTTRMISTPVGPRPRLPPRPRAGQGGQAVGAAPAAGSAGMKPEPAAPSAERPVVGRPVPNLQSKKLGKPAIARRTGGGYSRY